LISISDLELPVMISVEAVASSANIVLNAAFSAFK